MNKIYVIVVTLFMITFSKAQEMKTVPQIVVSGEGKIKVLPDVAIISIGVENTSNDAADAKKKNDNAIEAIIKYLKGTKLPASDYQTKQVSLFKNYDYEKKKHYYQASQTIVVTLKDVSKYDAIMTGLVDAGANTIHGIEFKSSKLAQYESEARVKAVQNANAKALDYAGALKQKVGKPLLVTDNSASYYPRPMFAEMKVGGDATMPRETLAIGEIEVTANVTITFALD